MEDETADSSEEDTGIPEPFVIGEAGTVEPQAAVQKPPVPGNRKLCRMLESRQEWKGRRFYFPPYVPLEIYRGAERGGKAGNGCLCAKGSHTVVFLPGNFGGKNDGDTQEV